MPNVVRFREQLQRNAVALISLVVAVTSLGYNTWRNEASEHNRNQRLVSIEILRNLGDLREVVLYGHYGGDDERGQPKTGWALVLTIRDLSMALDDPLPESGTRLWRTWDEHFDALGSDIERVEQINAAIEAVRKDTHALLQSLD